MDMKDKQANAKRTGFFVELGADERAMLDVLRRKHFISVARFLRQAIRDLYCKMEQQEK